MKVCLIGASCILFLTFLNVAAWAESGDGTDSVALGDYATCQSRRRACGENSLPCSQAYIACINQAQGNQSDEPVVSGFDPFGVWAVGLSPSANRLEHHQTGQWQTNHLMAAQKHLESGDAVKAVQDLATRHTFIWGGHAANAQSAAQQAADALANGNTARYLQKLHEAERELKMAERLHPERF
ncbi:MAG: hypothetical protein HY537_12485 [Deltaproteobacteria bacterium]|nr:hypothetical protein [Deltaproteobacteria bacterium]